MERKLTPKDFEQYKNRPRNKHGLKIYDEEKEYLYPGKAVLRKYENLGEEHKKADLLVDKILEQVLDDVASKVLGEDPRILEFVDDDKFKDKRQYKSRARPNNSDNYVTCAYCLAKFKNYDSLKQHVGKTKNTNCYKLHKVSGLPSSLEMRQKYEAKKFPCPHCGKRYVSEDSLRRHAGIHANIQQ